MSIALLLTKVHSEVSTCIWVWTVQTGSKFPAPKHDHFQKVVVLAW